MMNLERRHDLDWLRAVAFFVLIYFHTAIIFIPGGLPLIQNDETSIGLWWFVEISHQFRLALLFFISGVGVYFARRRISNRAFLQERSRRLLIPLVFSLVFVVPPMVYLEKLFVGQFSGGLFSFYGDLLFEGIYPKGNLSWHHMWFIAYLFLFCVVSIPIFRRLDKIESVWVGARVYGFALILYVPEIFLRPLFPGFPNLISDWANFTHWLLIFWAGYVFARKEVLLESAERMLPISLVTVICSTLVIILMFGRVEFQPDFADDWLVLKFMFHSLLRMLMVWSAILTLVGFAARYLRFSNRLLSYANEAVYPLFILHLTTITVLGYWLVSVDLSIFQKYMVITTCTLVSNLALYHFLIRPFDAMRLLFGVKPKQV